ncbi:MAG: hypothetical protein U0Q03_20815 [Acidimicrobiales bacterium]
MTTATIAPTAASHHDLLRSITALVREVGAAAALDTLRRDQVAFRVAGEPQQRAAFHETLAVFHVWAVDRLLRAGLSDTAVLWHPLTDERSPLSWWDLGTLRSPAARERFVASTSAASWEPAPALPELLVAA